MIEFKWWSDNDLFSTMCEFEYNDKTVKSFLHEMQVGDDTLEQITSYAAAQLGSQLHLHLYHCEKHGEDSSMGQIWCGGERNYWLQ